MVLPFARDYGSRARKLTGKFSNDFEVVSVCCNITEITKNDIGVIPIEGASALVCNLIG